MPIHLKCVKKFIVLIYLTHLLSLFARGEKFKILPIFTQRIAKGNRKLMFFGFFQPNMDKI